MYSILWLIFALSLYLIVHSYVIYPFWLLIFTTDTEEESEKFAKEDNLPTVGILMAAYNEEKVIGQKIESVFKANYPKDKISFYEK